MNFKQTFKALSAFALVCSQFIYGQVGSPAVSSAVRFEQYPVDMSTGLPKVTIPIYEMPTRSKDISLNLSLSYHQSSVAKAGLRSGNCGRGWNFSVGGVVQREGSDAFIYSFSFMGFSGKLVAVPQFQTNNVNVTITENGGKKLYAEASGSNNQIVQFRFYDDKGYKYVFEAIDIYHIQSGNTYTPTNISFQLTDIYDTNRIISNQYLGNILAHFNYTPYEESLKYGSVYKTNIVNMIHDIVVPGFGSIDLESGPMSDGDGSWFLYSSAIIKDFLGNQVKNFTFNTGGQYDSDLKLYNVDLNSLVESGPNGADPQIHNFYYRPVIHDMNDFTMNSEGEDSWGYRNIYDKNCDNMGVTNTAKVLEGVLEKISYPTGGCVIYNYESNTYSYQEGARMDVNGTTVDPEYYYDLYSGQNMHNYTITNIAALGTSFTITEATEVYFKVFGVKEYVSAFGGYVWPSFTLRNELTNSVITSISMSGNADNACMGYKRTLQPGTYSVRAGAHGLANTAIIYKIARKATPKKWWYGGGIRVATVAYFDYDAPQNFFYPGDFQVITTPTLVKYFTYTDLIDPNLSSGSTASYAGSEYAPIRYSNVTVRETRPLLGGANERTEFTFYVPSDFINSGLSATSDFRLGKQKMIKYYNSDNVLQKETAFTYDSVTSDSSGSQTDLYTMGWMMPKQILSKEYLGSTLQNKEDYEYDVNRNLKKRTVTTSRSAESQITNYYYHLDANGNPLITNRSSAIDHIDELLGSNPISTTKIEYGNNWQNVQGTSVNVAYLPSQILKAKGSDPLQGEIKNNLYDQYGNVLEVERVNGVKKSYVWGYNESRIIAEIESVSYVNIPSALIDAAKTASNSGNETSLLTALTNLRNNAQVSAGLVTTYTYKPLIGVSTVTDSRGYKLSYQYDSLGRQTTLKDQDGNIVSDQVYYTKPQN